MFYPMAVIGALTTTGQAVISALAERGYRSADVVALDAHQNKGMRVPFGDDVLIVRALDDFDFHSVRVVFLCTHSILARYANRVTKAGCYLIDCAGLSAKGMWAMPILGQPVRYAKVYLNPTGLTILIMKILMPLKQLGTVVSVDATVLSAAENFGETAVDTLIKQTRCLFTKENYPKGNLPTVQAFNLIPAADPILMRRVMREIKLLARLPVFVSDCLVPVPRGTALALSICFQKKPDKITEIFQNSGLSVVSGFGGSPMVSLRDVGPETYLIQPSVCPENPTVLHLWVLSADIKQTAVLNAIMISENLLS